MTEKEKRQQRARAEDAAFNRLLCWLVGAVVAETLVLVVKRFYLDSFNEAIAVGMGWFFAIFTYLGLVLIASGIVWLVLSAKKERKLTSPFLYTVIVAFVWLMSFLVCRLSALGVKIMMAVPAAIIVLILIYYLYNRAFFANAIITGCGMLGLLGIRHCSRTAVVITFIVGWIGIAAIFALTVYLKKNGGMLGKLRLVSDQKCYTVCWISLAVVFVMTLLGFILGFGAAYYLIYVLIGWLFCLAVYYTVKLM